MKRLLFIQAAEIECDALCTLLWQLEFVVKKRCQISKVAYADTLDILSIDEKFDGSRLHSGVSSQELHKRRCVTPFCIQTLQIAVHTLIVNFEVFCSIVPSAVMSLLTMVLIESFSKKVVNAKLDLRCEIVANSFV